MMSGWGRLSFTVVLLVLAAVTLVGVAGLRLGGAGAYSLLFLLVPIGAGGWYLYENRDHPPIYLGPRPEAEPANPAVAASNPAAGVPAADVSASAAFAAPSGAEEPMPSADEPFDDPVELADRLDSGTATPAAPDDPAAEPPQ